jgi:hypothetical protein
MKYSNNLQFCENYGYKKGKTTTKFFVDAGSVIRDGKKSGSRMNVSDPQHWLLSGLNWNFFQHKSQFCRPCRLIRGVV